MNATTLREGLQMDLCSQCGVRTMHSPASLLCAPCELITLRHRLAEAENSRNISRDVADAFRDTISRATGNPDAVHGLMMLCESHEKLAEAEARAEDFKRIGQGFERDMRKHFQQSCDNLQRAEKAQADAARWEGAAKIMGRYIRATDRVENGHGAEAIHQRILASNELHANPTASALVREGQTR